MSELSLSTLNKNKAELVHTHSADTVVNTPTGNITSTNIQNAVNELDTIKAPLASPVFTGIPKVPAPTTGDKTTQIATTAFVMDAITTALANSSSGGSTTGGSTTDATNKVGLKWDKNSDTYTRLGDASGQTRAFFDTIAPFKNIRRCNLADNGTVNAYYGDPLYKDDGSNGQVMVEIPLFYYLTTADSTSYTWYISNNTFTNAKPHPAFVRKGIVKSKIYISAYEGYLNGTKIESKSGVNPAVSQTLPTFRTYCSNRGTGWSQQDFFIYSAIQMLFLIEYGTFDSQTAIGQGNVNNLVGLLATGRTASLGNASGKVGTDGVDSVSYRGIENLWGNIYKFVDGVNISNGTYYVNTNADITTFISDSFSGNYSYTGITAPTSSGYASDIGFSAGEDYGYIPTAISGSSSTKLHDYYYCTSGNFVLFSGGSWAFGAFGAYGGLFCFNATYSSSYAHSDVGCRLEYIPQ